MKVALGCTAFLLAHTGQRRFLLKRKGSVRSCIKTLRIGVFECPAMAKSDQFVVQRQISTCLG
jgi:hypothetical protein